MQDLFVTLESGDARVVRTDGTSLVVSCDGSAHLSSGELVAAALASCIAATLAPIFERHAIPADGLSIRARPAGSAVGEGLNVEITLPPCEEKLLPLLKRAAERCPVKHALSIDVEFHWLTRNQVRALPR